MKPGGQVALIAGIAGTVTILHYAVDPHAGAIHDILQRVYYLPVVLGGLWFGARGGLLTALLISVVYFPHAFHGWHGPHSLFFRMSEITMYHVIGGLTGLLSSKLKAALDSEKRARQEREAAYERLREKTTELFALEEQLRRSERLAALGRLSAGLAHEIRNPLSSIQTSIELLRERHQRATSPTSGDAAEPTDNQSAPRPPDIPTPTEPGDDAPDFHAVLLQETERLNRILTNFLEFARAEVNKGKDELPLARLGDAAAKTAALLDPQCKKRNVRIEIDPAAHDVSVRIRESHLRQVFLNLFLNSLDAIPHGGRITVRLGVSASNPGAAEVLVEDTGPGIPPAIAGKIFDPFFTTKEQGTGLGLSIVERILSANGGEIWLESADAPSSRFCLRLPFAGSQV